MFVPLTCYPRFRSVRNLIDESGEILNSYSYDPFGKLLYKTERVRNIFQYLGSLGIVKEDELLDMYSMRDRVYDASHGRFISIDPLGKPITVVRCFQITTITLIGLVGRSTNFYVYAQNSPLNVKDPSGKILPLAPLIAPLLLRSALGAVESVAFDVALSSAEGKLPTVKGIV